MLLRSSIAKRATVAIITFLSGVAIATFWFSHRFAETKVADLEPVANCGNAFHLVGPDAACPVYFDAATFAADKRYGDSARGVYTTLLRGFGEPTLISAGNDVDEAYRFTFVRTWGNPVIVRTWRCGEFYFVSAGTLNLDQPEIVKTPRPLSAAQWSQLSDVVKRSRFWELPTVEEEMPGLDGAKWLVEGSLRGHFHVVDRSSDGDPAYKAIGKYMLSISGLDIVQSQIDRY